MAKKLRVCVLRLFCKRKTGEKTVEKMKEEKTTSKKQMQRLNEKNKKMKKERAIYTIGCPSFDALTQNERRTFYSALLQCVIEYFEKKTDTTDSLQQKEVNKE